MFILTILFGVILHVVWAQNHVLAYQNKEKEPFCNDYFEINPVHKKVFYIKTCGCIPEQMLSNIGMASYSYDGTQYILKPIFASQYLFASIKEYKQTANDTIPRIIFIDINNDTVSVDSLLTFTLNNKGEIKNKRFVRNIIPYKKIKPTSFLFDMEQLGKRTHFTLPVLYRVMLDDLFFSIPFDGKKTLVIQLFFPGYFHMNGYRGALFYSPLEGSYKKFDGDSFLVNKKTRITLKKREVN